MPSKPGTFDNLNAENFPLAVPDLREAARILDMPLAEVRRAAKDILVYPTENGPMYSLHQLHMVMGGAEAKAEYEAKKRKRYRDAHRRKVAARQAS